MSFLAHKHHSQKNIWTRGGGGTQYMANGNTHPAQSAQRGFFPVSPERRGTKNTQFVHAHMFR